MNNNDYNKSSNEKDEYIKKLEQELARLKGENVVTTSNLEVDEISSNSSINEPDALNTPVDTDAKQSIYEYYTNKYLEAFDKIKSDKLDEINNEVQLIENKISSLNDESAYLEKLEQENEEINIKIKEQNDLIDTLYVKIEEEKFNNDHEIDLLHEDSIISYQKYGNVVDNFFSYVRKFNNDEITFQELIKKIEETSDYFQSEGYQIAMTLKDNRIMIDKLESGINETLDKIKQEIDDATNVKNELATKINNVTKDKIIEVKNECLKESSRKNAFKEDIETRFSEIKDKHLYSLKDLDTRMNFVNTNSETKVAEFDKLISTFEKELLSLDTKANRMYQKEKELNKYTQLVESLANKVKELETVQNDYNYLQNIYNTLFKNIQTIEDYIKRVKWSFENNNEYLGYATYCRNYINTKRSLQDGIADLTKRYNMLMDRRRIVVCDPYTKESIKELDIQINGVKTDIAFKNHELDDLKRDFEEAHKNALYAKLSRVLQDKNKYEKDLPNIYDQVSKLKEKVNLKYDELSKIKDELKDYAYYQKKIEELKSELNN